MRKLILFVALAMTALPAMAELQNVTVGGEVRIRTNYYSAAFARSPQTILWPGFFLPLRAIGTPDNNVISLFAWNRHTNALKYTEERFRLNFHADFTDNVGAFIELDNYGNWGTDFRSDYITGADFPGDGASDVHLYQAYIEANEMWGLPLRVRVGRQELSFGDQWLVGNNTPAATGFYGLSFDALRLTYATDQFSVDAWASKLAERGNIEADGDVDFYGVYGTYKGIKNLTLDAYWLWVRDARSLQDTHLAWPAEWLEDWVNIDNYDVTNLHTVGLRGAGTLGPFDYNVEAAYQFGNASAVGYRFKYNAVSPTPKLFRGYGDDRARFDGNWGANAEFGYTFDTAWKPRVYVGGAYFGGEDNRSTSLWQWLNPFARPKASVSFNRLFSDWEYDEFLDPTWLSNVWILRGGVSATPVRNIDSTFSVTYFHSLKDFSVPRFFKIGRYRVPIFPDWSFWTQRNSGDLGLELEDIVTYHYTSDLTFNGGWAHLFVAKGLEQGDFNAFNGLGFTGGTAKDGADYVFLEADLTF